jgi:Electron transfer DM13
MRNILLYIVRYICIITTITNVAIVVTGQSNNTELSLGDFIIVTKNVSGEVVVLSDRVMEVRGFTYDGTAPALYFWADTNSTPSANGFRLYDGPPLNGCGTTPIPDAADGTETYRVEFPTNTTIFDVLGGSIAVWCESARTSFGHVRLYLFKFEAHSFLLLTLFCYAY